MGSMPNGNTSSAWILNGTTASFGRDIGGYATFITYDSFWLGCGTGIGNTARRRAIDQTNLCRGCGLGGYIWTIVQL